MINIFFVFNVAQKQQLLEEVEDGPASTIGNVAR